MEILFIRPNMNSSRSSDAMEPVVFAILSALTPTDVERRLYDERLEEIPLDKEPDLVAMTVETFTARRAYQIAAHYTRKGIPVVLGGFHATFRPQEALRYAHTVVMGDAEETWPRIVTDAKQRRLRRIYRGALPSLAGMEVDRSIFQGKRYRPIAMVQFGRGCRFSCEFCSIHAFYAATLRWRQPEDVARELEVAGRRYAFITDDNLFNDRARVKALLECIRPLGLKWACQASLDIASEPGLVRLMARSGCLSVMVGFETLNEDNLRQMGKSWNRRYGSYDHLVRVFRDEGVMVYGGFVFGYDHDTLSAFDVALEFALRNKLFLANFNPLAPTPGTPLYDRLKAEDRLIHDPWWLHPDFRYGDAMFRPRLMTPEQLTGGCYRARTQFNRYSNIAQRALDAKANCRTPLHAAAFALANLTSRREIHRKQGSPLGDPSFNLETVLDTAHEPVIFPSS